MDLAMITFRFPNCGSVPRVREWRGRSGGDRAQARRRTADPRVGLKRLHRRERGDGREQSLPPRPRACSHLRALLVVEQRPRVVDRLGGDIEDQTVAGLTKHIAPVVTRGPQLGVLEREGHGPDDRERDEVVIREERNRHQDRVHREIGCKLAPEGSDHRRLPSDHFFRGRLGGRVRGL